VDSLAARRHSVKRLIVASSVAIYGEGAYRCREHGPIRVSGRRPADLAAGRWEPTCPRCGADLESVATHEDCAPDPTRPYALSKYDQERLVLNAAREMGVQAAALRFFVTYGPRQALSNPYTGVISVFANRIRNGSPPVLYEDGLQTRDFIFVDDLVTALLTVLDAANLEHQVFNVGSGTASTVAALAESVARALGSDAPPHLPGRFRIGDVRHILADTTRLAGLGFKARVSLEEGVRRYMEWFHEQPAVEDRFPQAEQEADADGLIGEVRRP
jgi:dTDP-L-rhamnose 4-epimerase